jgi:hypothetical protein
MYPYEIQELLNRAGPLTFGVLGTHGVPPDVQAICTGSGIFITPFLAVTARHVSSALYELDPGGEIEFKRKPRSAAHSAGLFQVLSPGDPKTKSALWHVDNGWNFAYTDLCLMYVSAEDGASTEMQYKWPTAFFEIMFEPPTVGAIVQAIGFRKQAIRTEGEQLMIDSGFAFSEGTVTEIFHPYRDRGMMNFPCFRAEMRVDHGMSGGPVFSDGKLCGVISAGTNFDESAYVTSLWPLLRAEVDLGLGSSAVFPDLLHNGFLRSPNWAELASRIVVREDERDSYLDLT